MRDLNFNSMCKGDSNLMLSGVQHNSWIFSDAYDSYETGKKNYAKNCNSAIVYYSFLVRRWIMNNQSYILTVSLTSLFWILCTCYCNKRMKSVEAIKYTSVAMVSESDAEIQLK